jgi:iron complex transport system substrate-binding protein
VGDYTISIEAVVAARPDLVVAVADLQMPVINKLRELGICVLAVNPKTVEDVFRAMEMIGQAGGNGPYARMIVENLKARMRVIDRAVATLDPSDRPPVFVEIWNDPLMTAGSGTFIDDLLSRAGARNIASDVPGWPQFSTEMVLARAPQFIILTCFNKAEVMARREWRRAPAVITGKVYEVHPDILVRPGPRLVEGLEVLAAIFHPELFR